MEHPRLKHGFLEDKPPGQILAILAVAMVGLLVAGGLAVDAGVLFMRKSHLDRSVDAAALAGVVELTSTNNLANALNAANTRGQQVLGMNRIPTAYVADAACPATPEDPTFWASHDYCGERSLGTIPGSTRYTVEVHWQTETYFLSLVGFGNIPLISTATAEYMPLVDIFASDTSELGILKSSNELIFGPGICTGYGDPYTPTTSAWYNELDGVYTFRIRIPADFVLNHTNLRVEIFDPDSYNQPVQGTYSPVYNLNGTLSTTLTCSDTNDRKQPCLINIPGETVDGNPFWYVRLDENRGNGAGGGDGTCGEPASYTTRYNTRTLYRLYYLKQGADGSLSEEDLSYYIGKIDDPGQPAGTTYTAAQAVTELQATDMKWVSPGAPLAERMPAYTNVDSIAGYNAVAEPSTLTEDCNAYRAAHPTYGDALGCSGNGDFIITLKGGGNETPNIYVDPSTGNRDIYLQVRGLSGATENGFQLWAGPARSEDGGDLLYTAPSDVNARQTYLLRERAGGNNYHLSDGVGVFGIGHLPMNSNVNYRTDIPLAYLGPQFSGQQLTVQLFDADSGASPPLSFFFDTIPQSDWTACYDDNTGGSHCPNVGGQTIDYLGPLNIPNDNAWASYTFTIPSESDPTRPIPFYGGRLFVSYVGGTHDTFGWKITLDARPTLVK